MLYTKNGHNQLGTLLALLLVVTCSFGSSPNFSYARIAKDSLQPAKPAEHPVIEANNALKLISRHEYKSKDIYQSSPPNDDSDTPDWVLNENAARIFCQHNIRHHPFTETSFIRSLADKNAYPRAPPA